MTEMHEADDTRLRAIFQTVFELAPARDVTTVRQISEKAWDSLAHATLVAAIESEFGVSIDIAEALEMTSFEATRQILEEKLV
jgi:acyl carrier protein